MSKKFKVKTAAVFNGQPVGSIIELDESLAKYYEALKYLVILEEAKPAKKSTSATKKPASKRTSTKSKKTEAKSEDKDEN